jgi:hypothetical protein
VNHHLETGELTVGQCSWLGTSWLLGFDWFGFRTPINQWEKRSLFGWRNRIICLSWDIGRTKLGYFVN